MSTWIFLWCLFGYLASGMGWYLILMYLGIKGVVDKWSIFYIDDAVEAIPHILLWPMSMVTFAIGYLFQRLNELQEKLRLDMEKRNRK